jgi:tetratricopeptide (TPR) repeat protein
VFGGDHPGILTSVDNLGFALAGLGKYKDAETMHQRALAMRQKFLGAEHPDMLVSMRHLSDNWKTQGRDIEAIELLQRVVRLKCQSLGAEHPQTRSSMIQLNKWKVYCGGSFLFALPRPHF